MRLSSTAQVSTFLALAALLFSAEAQSRRRISVRTYRTNYRIDTWDDGRDELYRVTFWKFGLKSVYTFDAAGHARTLTARDTLYTFEPITPNRMLITSSDDALQEVETDPTPAIDCTTCEVTWNTLCDVGLADVCVLDDSNPVDFDEDAHDSVRRFCGAVGAACERTASDVCGKQCVQAAPQPTTAEPTAVPTSAPTWAPTSTPTSVPTDDELTPETSAPTSAPTSTPTSSPTSAPPSASTSAPTATPTLSTSSAPTSAPTSNSTLAPTSAPTLAPTQSATSAPTSAPTSVPTSSPTSAPTEAATSTPTSTPTASPTEAENPETATADPTPAPTTELSDCNPNPCQFGGACSIDPAGGHTCSCTNDYGGMSCQIDTSELDTFFIEVDFIGAWTDARMAIFQSAADRWAEVVTHVPCGGTEDVPGGRLLITATLAEIDGVGGAAGSARPSNVWNACRTISLKGDINLDVSDIADLEATGLLEGVILHEMGHVIGVGTLWGPNFGGCSSCLTDGSPAWTCPAALSTYASMGGFGADIVESDGEVGSICTHLDEEIFDNELMSRVSNNPMFLSKMTAATLEDMNYIVDASAVDPYVLPSERGGSIRAQSETSMVTTDTAVETVVLAVDSDGIVVDELVGTMIEF